MVLAFMFAFVFVDVGGGAMGLVAAEGGCEGPDPETPATFADDSLEFAFVVTCAAGSNGVGCPGGFCGVIFGVAIFGVLVFGVLIFGVLIFGVLIFGVLIFGVLIFGVLIFGVLTLVGELVVACVDEDGPGCVGVTGWIFGVLVTGGVCAVFGDAWLFCAVLGRLWSGLWAVSARRFAVTRRDHG